MKRSRGTVIGTLRVGRGGPAFVIPKDGGPEVLLAGGPSLGALPGDHVEASVKQTRWGLRGRILSVIEARPCRGLGVLERAGKGFRVSLDRSDLPQWLNVRTSNLHDACVGERVWVELERDGAGAPTPNCRILEVLGRGDDPALDFRAVTLEMGLPGRFPKAVLQEAASLGSRRIGRTGAADFRDDMVFTIDPEDAKDHDDALSLRRKGGGVTEVGVHIADVSRFVSQGSALDREAGIRGTSVYLCDGVIPMLPPRLSENLCSLLPDRSRPTLSVVFEMDGSARVRSYRIVEGAVKSRARLSYDAAEGMLLGGSGDLGAALRKLADLADRMAARRARRGSLDLALPETKVVLNDKSAPVEVRREQRLATHGIIEEFMLLANETLATEASKRRVPFVYRIHPPPQRDKLQELSLQLGELGVRFDPRGVTKGRDLKAPLNAVADERRRALASYLVLRAMERARYAGSPSVHFGLASDCYCHFTSPIRRYPDLFNHRMIKAALFGGGAGSCECDLDGLSASCSDTEYRAETAERKSVEIKCIRFMEGRLGESYSGMVSGVTARGYMIRLDEYPVEGFAPTPFRPRRKRGRGGLFLGDRVQVSVVRANPLMRELEFAVIKNGHRGSDKP